MYIILLNAVFIQDLLYFEQKLEIFCPIGIFLEYPVVLMAVFVTGFNLARYMIVTQITRVSYKSFLKSDSQTTTTIIQSLKFLSSSIFEAICLTIFIGAYYIVMMVIYARNQYTCSSITGYPFISFIALAYIFYFIIMIIDILMNIKILCRCGCIQYFFKNDPYIFRLEALYFIIFAPLISVIDIFFRKISFRLAEMAITFYYIVLFLGQPCLILSVIFLRKCLQRFSRTANITTKLGKCFIDDELFDLFLKFAQKEYSQENVLIKRDIMRFCLDPSLERAEKIYYRYLNGSSSLMEVNIELSLCREVFTYIQAKKITPNLFTKVNGQVEINLRDTFERFALSGEYKEYQSSRSLEKLLLEGDKAKEI
jgi:hypothetical protein